jgi:hypothetical protein
MTIQDWGAVGEIVGAIAVVASLIYLAIQIRQNTHQIAHSIESMKLSAFERNIEAGNRIRELIILHPGVADLALRGMSNFSSLPKPDKMRFDMLIRNMFSEMQGSLIRTLTLDSDPGGTAGISKTIDLLVKNPGVRDWLKHADPDWRNEFAELVSRRAALATDKNKRSES